MEPPLQRGRAAGGYGPQESVTITEVAVYFSKETNERVP